MLLESLGKSGIEIICALMAYLLGSIPSAIWVGRKFYGIDVREHGYLAVVLAYMMEKHLYSEEISNASNSWFFPVVFGVLSVIGHMLPVFAKFKGGKGVATLFGIIIALDPRVAGLALLVFVLVNIVTGYVSVGSLMAGLSIPVLFLQVFGYRDMSIVVFGVSVGVLIVYTHRKNIKRLMAGEETKSRILVKKQK
ncbi:MAG: glycerol-3-phosphate acyltransferase [Bacteroidetes bacterium]|nr:glycerol-3-phosphate acyltransferase [Bacteroidota bacterium]